jgi:uncharacterized protein
MQFIKAVNFILKKLAKDLPAHLTYHSINHITDVYQAAEYIGKQEHVSAKEMKLLLTAAAFHDAGFIKGAKGHEEESCRIATENLPAFGYTSADIKKICGLIMATKIPQSPKNHLEEILADADLDYLGRDDFFTIGDRLYHELLTSGVVANEDQWHGVQERFMESHHYFTKTSVSLRQATKDDNLKQVKAKLGA